jgi:hypothetical protein
MRASLYASMLALWASILAGCLAAPKAEDWLAVGFRTPAQTFRTFQTGLRADLPDLEYRCLSSSFKRRAAREGGAFSQLVYREFRRELFRAQPWLKLAARARVRRIEELAPDRVRLVAEVETWFHDETFELVLVREDFYELYVGEQRVSDDLAKWRELVRAEQGALVARVPLPGGLGALELGELRVGREWKFDGFPERLADGARKDGP